MPQPGITYSKEGLLMLDAQAATSVTTTSAPSAVEEKLPIKLVTHDYPDTDAFASIWAAGRFIAEAKGREYTIAFVKAGDALPADEAEGFEVITVDTGRGKLDQHGKILGKISSFRLLCAEYGLLEDPGIKPIIELTVLSDNVQRSAIPFHSIHYQLKALPWYYRDKVSKAIDWQAVINEANKMFDIMYDQASRHAKAVEEFARIGRTIELPNGIKIGSIWHKPHLRQAAYDAGCHVVIWTQDQKPPFKGKFYVGIQVHEKADPELTLESVIAGIRFAEASKRGTSTKGVDMRAWGQTKELFGGWFMHDSRRLIACGTRGHELTEESEFPKLSEREIVDILKERLKPSKLRKKDLG